MPTRAQSPGSAVLSLTGQLETPLGDDRSYEHFVMGNQLEVFLAHDAATDRASVAMDVGVGNFSDDPGMPGMAHAVE
jgi:insulysin